MFLQYLSNVFFDLLSPLAVSVVSDANKKRFLYFSIKRLVVFQN